MTTAFNTYFKGALVRVSNVFENAAGIDLDPTTVKVKVTDPSGTTTTYTYLIDAAVVKDSTGNYHIDVDADEEGTWHYRWEGSGVSGQSATEGKFDVNSDF